MISEKTIQQAVARLVAASNPSKVILFGCFARGDATENSDEKCMKAVTFGYDDTDSHLIRREVVAGMVGTMRLYGWERY